MLNIIKHNYNGILVERGDYKGMARSIINLANDTDFKSNIIINAYNTVNQNYDLKKMLTQYENLLFNNVIR